MEFIKKLFTGHPVVPFTEDQKRTKGGHGFTHRGVEYVHYSTLGHEETAFQRLSRDQRVFLIFLFAILIFSFILNWHLTLIVIISALTILYFTDFIFNMYLITRSFSKSEEVKISDRELHTPRSWPTYTILCPLYKEWRVLPQFIHAMSQLNYPKDKLQIMLLLEADDTETISHAKKFDLPSYFDIVVVPNSKPKTKPKACNYGLKFATGEYVVVYDAEDVPDPFQLKKAVLAFDKLDNRVVCVQAKLNFYNPTQNLISRIFAAEYSLWFELVLTGLQSIYAPIPLGGTSNHFRKTDLQQLKGWDSFNVTEDCDLGMRIAKQGHRTAIIDSLTLEEANSDAKNWFSQRTRWIKGYIQTYFLHMRRPQDFIRKWKEPHVITFQLIVGGKVLSTLINPFMWAITITYFVFRAYAGTFIESLFLTSIYYMGMLCLTLGNFLYLYYYMVGCAKHGHFRLVKYAFLVPFYWLAMGVASWVAVYRFISAPHYWSKTKHGLHLKIDQKKEPVRPAIPTRRLIPNFGKLLNYLS